MKMVDYYQLIDVAHIAKAPSFVLITGFGGDGSPIQDKVKVQ